MPSDRELKNKYKFLSSVPIGSGGYAEVYRVAKRETGEVVALKRLIRMAECARFKREIAVQRAINHPNVMPVLDRSSYRNWYTMPLAEYSLAMLKPPLNNEAIARVVQ